MFNTRSPHPVLEQKNTSEIFISDGCVEKVLKLRLCTTPLNKTIHFSISLCSWNSFPHSPNTNPVTIDLLGGKSLPPCQAVLHHAPVESSFLKQLGSNRGTSGDLAPWAPMPQAYHKLIPFVVPLALKK